MKNRRELQDLAQNFFEACGHPIKGLQHFVGAKEPERKQWSSNPRSEGCYHYGGKRPKEKMVKALVVDSREQSEEPEEERIAAVIDSSHQTPTEKILKRNEILGQLGSHFIPFTLDTRCVHGP